jgi:holin-like protein
MKNPVASGRAKRLTLSSVLSSIAQVAAFVLVWLGASTLTETFALPISAGALGLLAVLALLLSGAVKVNWLKGGADLILNELVLFFIPCVVAVIKYADLFRAEGVQLVFSVTLGTILVMASTALAVHAGCWLEKQLAQWALKRQARRAAAMGRKSV